MRSNQSRIIFVGELKCELEYENYKYLTLTSSSQIKHHSKNAFEKFLYIAKNNNNDRYKVTIKGKNKPISGAILVWGNITPEGRTSVMNDYGLADVLSLEQIINDLIIWNNQDYLDFIKQREKWCQELFILLGKKI